jgi:hypothetical protein
VASGDGDGCVGLLVGAAVMFVVLVFVLDHVTSAPGCYGTVLVTKTAGGYVARYEKRGDVAEGATADEAVWNLVRREVEVKEVGVVGVEGEP